MYAGDRSRSHVVGQVTEHNAVRQRRREVLRQCHLQSRLYMLKETNTMNLQPLVRGSFAIQVLPTFLNCSMRSASSLARSNSLLMVKEYFSGRLLFHVTERGDFGLPPFLLGLLLPGKSMHTMNILCNRVFSLRVGCIRETSGGTKRFSYTSTVSACADEKSVRFGGTSP